MSLTQFWVKSGNQLAQQVSYVTGIDEPLWVVKNNQGCESSDFNLISSFSCSSQNPIFRLSMH